MQKDTKTYEISFLATTEDGVGGVTKHLNQVGAKVTDPGKIEHINLSYPIKKHSSAYMGVIHFELSPEEIASLRDVLKFEEGILRYTIVTPPFAKSEEPQPRGPRVTKEVVERASSGDSLASNADLEAKLEEISGSLEKTQ